MMLNYKETQVREFFKDNGYYIFRNIIPHNVIESCLQEIDVALQSQWAMYFANSEYPGKDIAIVKLFERNPNYRRLIYEWLNKRMLSPYRFAMLPEVMKINSWIGIKHPMFQMAANRFHLPNENEFKTGTHQDIGIMTTFNSVTMWLPLIPALYGNGTIKLWAKSHNEGVIVPEGPDYRGHSWIADAITDRYEEVWVEYYPGDLVIFDTKTIHTSMPNKSDNCRWAVIFRFDDAEDNTYFDAASNPLTKGYIMERDTSMRSGFSPTAKKN